MAALQWFVVPALAALAHNIKSTRRVFTPTELSTWATNDRLELAPGLAAAALDTLKLRGFVTPEAQRRYRTDSVNRWRVTSLGLQAAQAALRATPSGPVPDVQALPIRLWNLLRIRRRLTAAEAAQTLVDADDGFEVQAKRIGALLAAWAKQAPKAVAVAHKREAGHIRYVLVRDIGRWPPPSRPGQMHPSDFANTCAVPARYLKGGSQQ